MEGFGFVIYITFSLKASGFKLFSSKYSYSWFDSFFLWVRAHCLALLQKNFCSKLLLLYFLRVIFAPHFTLSFFFPKNIWKTNGQNQNLAHILFSPSTPDTFANHMSFYKNYLVCAFGALFCFQFEIDFLHVDTSRSVRENEWKRLIIFELINKLFSQSSGEFEY